MLRSLNPAMLNNYFKAAKRNLAKNRFFTVVNVFGLALGMSLSLMYIAWATFVFRFDDFHANIERIYRVTTLLKDNQNNPRFASAPSGLAQKLRNDFTGIDKVVTIRRSLSGEAVYLDKRISLKGYFSEPEFLEMFNFPLIKGNRASALTLPKSIILTETEARKIFGSEEPIGQIISIAPYGDFEVTGILLDIPVNSHMNFGAVASYSTLTTNSITSQEAEESAWREFRNSYIYVRLPEDGDLSKLQGFLDHVARAVYSKTTDVETSFSLQRLDKINPGPEITNRLGVEWDYLAFVLTGIMPLLILVAACSNYINLSISQSLKRMKEIGVRKVMGGQRKQIIFQFIMETSLTMLLALVASYFIFELIRREFVSQAVDTGPLDLTPTFLTVVSFIGFTLLTGIAAGIVPAVYFSRIAPVVALKGKPESTTKGMRIPLRKVIITLQFALSLGFTMVVVVMLQQYRFSVNYDFGFQRENILDVRLQNVDPLLFKTEYGKLSAVERISMSSHIPGLEYEARFIRTENDKDSIETAAISIDENLISNIELELLAGENFTDNPAQNVGTIIINEEFLKKLNFTDPITAVNRYLLTADGESVRIRGVVKNFHYSQLRDPIGNFFFEYDPSKFKFANMKVASAGLLAEMTTMEKLWKDIGGENKFTAQLLSGEIKDAYDFYFLMVKLWGFMGLLAITVTCLGLLGAVVFTLRGRLKEISIRKVMGASSSGLVYLLSRDFIYMMMIASIITIPVVTYIMDYMLMTVQTYSIQIGFVEIFASLVIIGVLGLTTIISQTRRAANANPVDNLRTE